MISFFELLSGERLFSLLKTLSDWQFWFEGLESGRDRERRRGRLCLVLAAYQTYLYLCDRRSLVRDYDFSAQPRTRSGPNTLIDSCLWENLDVRRAGLGSDWPLARTLISVIKPLPALQWRHSALNLQTQYCESTGELCVVSEQDAYSTYLPRGKRNHKLDLFILSAS